MTSGSDPLSDWLIDAPMASPLVTMETAVEDTEGVGVEEEEEDEEEKVVRDEELEVEGGEDPPAFLRIMLAM